MGRRRRPKHNQNYRDQRDTPDIATSLDVLSQFNLFTPPVVRSSPMEIEDHREYRPLERSKFLTVPRILRSASIARTSSTRVAKFTQLDLRGGQQRFAVPKQTMVCVRRTIRRQVLFAKGRGGGGHKRPRRNQWSNVRC